MCKEKQIEEMAEYIDEVSEFIIFGLNDAFAKVKLACERVAEKLYNAGYRKQIEGEWIGSDQTDEFVCSLCGGIAPVDCEKEAFYKSNFCPNCGARMKGGAE